MNTTVLYSGTRTALQSDYMNIQHNEGIHMYRLFLERSTLMFLTAILCFVEFAHAQTPLETFFRNPAARSPALSPSGKLVAMLLPTSSGRIGLAVASIDAPSKFVGIAQFDDGDIRSFAWVNDGRLVFDAYDQNSALGEQLGNGLYAVNSDGSDFAWLIERTGSYRRIGSPAKSPLPYRYQYVRPVLDGSDDVLIQHWIPSDRNQPSSVMMRLNTRNITVKDIGSSSAPDGVLVWVLDQALQARAIVATDGKERVAVYWRDIDGNKWEKLTSFDMFDPGFAAIDPLAVDQAGRLYVSGIDKTSKGKTKSLYRYDLSRRQVEDVSLLSIPGFDFDGKLIFDTSSKQLIGVSYVGDAPGVTWFDKSMIDEQEKIDGLLPNTINTIGCTHCTAAQNFIVTSTSDVQSPVYFLYERKTQKLSLLGSTRPWLDSSKMPGSQDFARVAVRDGLEIPIFVTKPKGRGPWPTVIMVHGGPYVRGIQWGFNPINQFLASRGYAVIEPEFRGSTGYGYTQFKLGWKQWGLTMQDDVTDVTRWAIANGIAEPKRIAIAGASYGGYSAMMGLLREPDLYKAGINIVGVTDISLMFSIDWSDFQRSDSPWARYGMRRLIGDPDTDSLQFANTSPFKNAGKIKHPVLMAYGEEDIRVPLPHGEKFRDALIASGNRNVEWIQYAGEGHGFMLTKNNVDLWTRIEKFLEKHVR